MLNELGLKDLFNEGGRRLASELETPTTVFDMLRESVEMKEASFNQRDIELLEKCIKND